MKIKKIAIVAIVTALLSGCHMYSDSQIKPHQHSKVHKVVVQKVYTTPLKPSVYHQHPANGYSKVKKHAHPGGGKAHRHNYGKTPAKKPDPQVLLVKVVSSHGHHHHKHH